MNNSFGIVVKPMFDESVFKPGDALLVSDYTTGSEFSAIVASVNPVFIELLYFDPEINNGKFLKISIESFVDGLYEFNPLVKQVFNKPSVGDKSERIVEREEVIESEVISEENEESNQEVIEVDEEFIKIAKEVEERAMVSSNSKTKKDKKKDKNKFNPDEEDEIGDLE